MYALPDAIEHRLERIETAVDSIAVEVERIGEVQRYSLRLEEERESRRLNAAPGARPDPLTIASH